jgi:cell division protein ZapA
MSDPLAHRSESTPVTIFGKTYHLRGDGYPGYLAELAAEVDRRMRAVAESTGTADTLKIAILAALNLADESFQPVRTGDLVVAEERLGKLVALLDEALVE